MAASAGSHEIPESFLSCHGQGQGPKVIPHLWHYVLLLRAGFQCGLFSCSQAFASPLLCPSCLSVGYQETP